jgi:hypothetical protein
MWAAITLFIVNIFLPGIGEAITFIAPLTELF